VRAADGQRCVPRHGLYSPSSGYRYDGLFRVDEYWQETGKDGFRIWRFRLVAVDGETSKFTAAEGGSQTPAAPGRVETTIQRIVRSTKVAEAVKHLHDYTCQVCGTRLTSPAGPYGEAAHIRALGLPHNGPAVLENLLCLCPNDHVLFDAGAIYIDHSYGVRESGTHTSLGALTLRAGHTPDHNYISYHREHFAGQIGT
jgi:putative restriction endonuclease